MSQIADVAILIKAALESTIYLAPDDLGLSHDEIVELTTRLSYRPGEISDAMKLVNSIGGTSARRWGPAYDTVSKWTHFLIEEDPPLINFKALDFFVQELKESARDLGARQARIDPDVTIQRGARSGFGEHELRVARRILVLSERLAEKDGILTFPNGNVPPTLPSQLAKTFTRGQPTERADLKRVLPIVRDILGRRTDGRQSRVEPLDAFGEALGGLGYGQFRLWWMQAVAELRRTDAESSPLSSLVLSAALVEGALTFVVKRGRALDLGPFASSDFREDARRWKLDDLVTSASKGGPNAILDANAQRRADTLLRSRQRIHAGRMMSEFPTGVPDLRPEEARDAKATTEIVVRRILDWLDQHPSDSPAPVPP